MKYTLTFLLLFILTFAKGELLLVYEVEFYPVIPGKTISEDSISKQEVSVYLADSAIYIVRGKHINVYDFAKEKIYYLNMPAKSYDETSLYSEIDFRATEFLNRLYMKQFLEEGNLQNSMGSLFEMETLFGLEKTVDSLKNAISVFPRQQEVNFFLDDEKMCSVKYSNIALQKHLQMFYRFLLYETQIHPAILRTVRTSPFLPEELSFKFNNSGKEYFVKYKLKDRDPRASVSELKFNYYFFEYKFSNSLLTKINKVYGYIHHQPFSFVPREKVIEEYEGAVKKKNFLDAFLILMEAKLSTNEDFTAEFEKLQEIGDKDKKFMLFMNVLEKPDEELDIRSKIELVESLKRKKISRSWLLDAFLANYYASVEETQMAIELLEKVININPYLTAVYVDLGELLAETYKMKTAWKCYEIALKLNPKHPMNQRVIYKKQFLKYTFPDFFY